MGSSQSTLGRLDVPLRAQTRPFLATDSGVVSETPTVFSIKPGSLNDPVDVFDADSNEVVYRFKVKPRALSQEATLETPRGRVLLTTKMRHFPGRQQVFDGDQTDRESCLIDWEYHYTAPSVVYADFQDRLSGSFCRAIVEGNSSDEVVIVYLQRSPQKLYTLYKDDDRTTSRFQAIGRIRFMDRFPIRSSTYVVEVAPGVDILLMLVLWRQCYELEHGNQTTL